LHRCKMSVGAGKVDKAAPQDAASKKARAIERSQARHKARAISRPKTGKKVVTQGKNTVLKIREDIKVIKRRGGTVRFAKALAKIRKDQKAKSLKDSKVVPKEAKEAKGTPKCKKMKVCRMRKVYHTQLPMKFAPAKGSMRHVNNPTKLRKSLVPGTVCIIVAGRHQSKKCIFLKQIKRSGLLLVTGPHKVNGVPLRRVDQKHVIATSLVLPLPEGFKVPGHVDDFFFKTARGTKKNSTTKAKDATLKGKTAKKEQKKPDLVRRKAQHAIDKAMIKALKKHEDPRTAFKYMKRAFTLIGERYAHNIKF